MQGPISSSWLGQLGIALATTTSTKLRGDIWEDADPDFNNFSYKYKINHTYLALKGKAIAAAVHLVQPYVSASIGVGFNNPFGFQITPKIEEEVPAPPFASHTTTALSYTVGTGIQKCFDRHWSAGFGYEFANWGKNNLGRAPGQTLNTGLALKSFYTNTVLVNLTYVS